MKFDISKLFSKSKREAELAGEPERSAAIRTPTQQLLWDLGITARARFAAARRLADREAGFTRLTALTSSYLIILTVFGRFIDLPSYYSSRIDLVSVALAIIILASSLLQNASQNAIKADQHQRSAMELNHLRGVLEARGEVPLAEVLDIHAQYNSVIHKYAINHSLLDFKEVQLDRRHEFKWIGLLDRTIYRFSISIHKLVPNLFLIIVTTVVIWIIFGFALPAALDRPPA